MGIRETQIFGLNSEALGFLDKNCKRTGEKTCPTCKHVTGGDKIVKDYKDESGLGMFDDGPTLQEYTLKEGGVAREVVQASPWSSGPCIFLCLEIDGKRMFMWEEGEIQNC